MKCSTRKAPTGTIPLRECNRRRRKELPCPARKGGTPLRVTVLAEAATINDSLIFRSAEDNLALSILPRGQVKKREGQIDGSLYVGSKRESDEDHRRKGSAHYLVSAAR